jgi:hypothetical protein
MDIGRRITGVTMHTDPLASQPARRKQTLVATFITILVLLAGFSISALPIGVSLRITVFLLAILAVLLIPLLPDSDPPRYGVLVAFISISMALFLLWPRYAYLPYGALPTKSPQRAFHAMAIALWLFSLGTSKELRSGLLYRIQKAPLIFAGVFGFFFWRILTCFTSFDPLFSAYTESIELFEYLSSFVLAVTFLRDEKDVERFISVLITVAFLVCCLGLLESFRQKNLFEPLIKVDRDSAAFFNEVLSDKLRGGKYRVKASFDHPLLLAEYLVAMIPLIAYRFFFSKALTKVALILLSAMLAVVVYKTQSRSAIATGIVLMFAYVSLLMMRSFFRNKLDMTAVAILCLIPGLVAIVIYSFDYMQSLVVGRSAQEAASSAARVLMITRGVPLVGDSPIFGYGTGLGAFKLGFIGEGGLITLDNYYLSIALDSGIPALLIYASLLLWGCIHAFQIIRDDERQRAFRRASLGLVVFSFVLFKSILGTPHNSPLLFFVLGTLVVLSLPRKEIGHLLARSYTEVK